MNWVLVITAKGEFKTIEGCSVQLQPPCHWHGWIGSLYRWGSTVILFLYVLSIKPNTDPSRLKLTLSLWLPWVICQLSWQYVWQKHGWSLRKESILCGYVSATLYLLLDQKIHRGYSSSMPFLNMIGYQDSMQKVIWLRGRQGVFMLKFQGHFHSWHG